VAGGDAQRSLAQRRGLLLPLGWGVQGLQAVLASLDWEDHDAFPALCDAGLGKRGEMELFARDAGYRCRNLGVELEAVGRDSLLRPGMDTLSSAYCLKSERPSPPEWKKPDLGAALRSWGRKAFCRGAGLVQPRPCLSQRVVAASRIGLAPSPAKARPSRSPESTEFCLSVGCGEGAGLFRPCPGAPATG